MTAAAPAIAATTPPGDEQLSLAEAGDALVRRRRLVLGLAAAGFVASLAVALLLSNTYTGIVRILPPQQSQPGAAAILGQAGSALAQLGAAGIGMRNPSDLFVAMLKSRTVADEIIGRFELKAVYDEDTMTDTRRQLENASSINADKTGVITIKIGDRDPQRAADIANAYAKAIVALTQRFAVTEAAQRRVFFEQQLADARRNLETAESELRAFKERTGLIQPEGQAGLTMSASATLRAQITAKEVQIAAMRTYATDANPDLVAVQHELQGLRRQLSRMDSNSGKGKGDVLVAIGDAPEASLEYQRRFRELRYRETLLELLARQYESARIDEAQEAAVIQVLDNAIVPEKKSGPPRTLIVVLGTLSAALLGVLAALTSEALARRRAMRGAALS